jgi:hypothetical protein
MDNGVNGCLLSKKLVYKFIEHAIKNESMKGIQSTSIIFPKSPGFKVAACTRYY